MTSTQKKPDPALFADLEARGLAKQVTDPALAHVLANECLTLYAGFDPTSDSLHVGSLLPLLTLRRFQLAGHRVIAVVGGATGMIGDPSGKSQERTLLDDAQIQHNLKGISAVIARFLDLQGPNPARVANNFDWFRNLTFVDFLRDTGKHFTVNHMMAKESVRARLEDREHGISYTEFSYMLLQAYDFYVLNREERCRLQIGGSDQWGNITAGTELIRRMRALSPAPAGTTYDGDPLAEKLLRKMQDERKLDDDVYGLTHPLVTKADGTKFGKTESGTVWLDAHKTSPYRFYQFFIQTADADVMNYLKFFSFRAMDELHALAESLKTAPEKREAQRALATELTRLVHGEAELARVEKATQALFGAEIRELDARTLLDIFAGAPSTKKPRSTLAQGLPLVDALVETGLCASKGAARKEVTAGGIYVNNARIADPAALLREADLIAGHYAVLRKGKKTYHLLSFES